MRKFRNCWSFGRFTNGSWTFNCSSAVAVRRQSYLTVSGTDVLAKGNIRLQSDIGNVTVKADQDFTRSEQYTKKSKYFGLSKSEYGANSETTKSLPSFVSSGGDVILDSAAGDLVVNGSVVAAKRDIRLRGRTIKIEAAEDVSRTNTYSKKSGIFAETSSGGSSTGYTIG